MKLLTLEIKNFEGVNAYYDFTAGANVKNADEAIAGLKSLLFGNEAVFSGEIILNADLDGKLYTVVRNFASGVEVYSGEDKLSDEATDAVLSDLAVLSRSRWETNASPCDEEAFLSDTDDYIKSFLSGMLSLLYYDSPSRGNMQARDSLCVPEIAAGAEGDFFFWGELLEKGGDVMCHGVFLRFRESLRRIPGRLMVLYPTFSLA